MSADDPISWFLDQSFGSSWADGPALPTMPTETIFMFFEFTVHFCVALVVVFLLIGAWEWWKRNQ